MANTSDTMASAQRLDVVDALRGFALLAIVLLHNLEHYNIFYGNLAVHFLAAVRIQFLYTDEERASPRT